MSDYSFLDFGETALENGLEIACVALFELVKTSVGHIPVSRLILAVCRIACSSAEQLEESSCSLSDLVITG